MSEVQGGSDLGLVNSCWICLNILNVLSRMKKIKNTHFLLIQLTQDFMNAIFYLF